MVTGFQFPTMEGESRGGLISLEAREYWYIVRDILAIMQETIESGRELSTDMSYSRLILDLNMGLNFIYAKEELTSITFIYPHELGYIRLRLYNTDYIVFEEEIRNLIKYCSP